MRTSARVLVLANIFAIYALTLSWPELLLWSDVVREIYGEFSKFYLVEFVFGGVSLLAIIGLSRGAVLRLAQTKAGIALCSVSLLSLCYVNIVGFAVTPYVSLSFQDIQLDELRESKLLTEWLRATSARVPDEEGRGDATSKDRTNIFTAAMVEEPAPTVPVLVSLGHCRNPGGATV
jgi:hypothetical protein